MNRLGLNPAELVQDVYADSHKMLPGEAKLMIMQILSKSLQDFLIGTIILKLIWECKGTRAANKILKKKKVGGVTLSDFQRCDVAAGIEPEGIGGVIDTLNRRENLEIDPNKYSQLTCA